MSKSKKQWIDGNLIVAKEFYHHHAYEILNTHNEFRDNLIDSISTSVKVESFTRNRKRNPRRITAASLNNEIRRLIKTKVEFKLEVIEKRGVFYFSSKSHEIGGFDFALINHSKNLLALRNLCFGELQYHEGERKWTKFLEKNEELAELAQNLKNANQIGRDIEYKPKQNDPPLIVGEIQFGNWALAYRDFFKVLKANVQNSIDCLVYIVPAGKLERLLSDGIVNYSNTVELLEEFKKVITVPVWVVGLDISIDE